MLEHLRSHGVPIQRSYVCTDNPAGSKPHDKDSVFMFPNTGCLYHAAQVDGIDLRRSWVIGDSSLELVAGWRAGCRLAGVQTGLALADGQLDVDPDITSPTLAEVLTEVTAGEHIQRR
jgi:histidinol phosphatase-like enzyme